MAISPSTSICDGSNIILLASRILGRITTTKMMMKNVEETSKKNKFNQLIISIRLFSNFPAIIFPEQFAKESTII